MNRFGDGLVTLLMFALGLGCLTLVFNGLVDGVVSGSKGATFPFATKPIKFLLIELVWVSLGLILLLGAWRGLTRQQVDIDDEQDDDEDHVATRPISRPVAPTTASSGAVHTKSPLLVARTSASKLPQPMAPVPPTRTPNLDALDAKRAGPLPKGVEPKTLELYTSRIYAIFVAIVFTLFVISSAYTSVALASIFGKALTAILFVPTVLVYAITMTQCVRNFFWSEPVLVFDKFGVTNYRKGGHLIPWVEVDAVRLDTRGTSTYLILRFRHASDMRVHFGNSRWLQSLVGHLFYKGFEGRVKLTSLVFKRSLVLQTAQSFLRYSRR